MVEKTASVLYDELKKIYNTNQIADKLNLHIGTLRRWEMQNKVPQNYYNDLNSLLDNKYAIKNKYRDNDQFFTTEKISQYCVERMLKVLKDLDIDETKYTYIEPSAGCCSFYSLLPKKRRIGIDIDPKGKLQKELIKMDYLKYLPSKKGQYIVIGNPPFGLRGNLALRFINHSYEFADIVAFILPPLFNSTGKGVPMKRIVGYKLAWSESLPKNSYVYPNGKPVEVTTIFQVWTKVNTDKILVKAKKTCDTYAKVYSLSDGGTPASTRNKNMLNKCDVYLPSTCFKGMKAYKSFEELPNRRGYGVVFFRAKKLLKDVFFNKVNWVEVAFESTNGAVNLRTDIIMNEISKRGYCDEK